MTEVTVSEGLKSRMTPDEIRKYRKLPQWLRDMVEGVQEDLEEAAGELEESQLAADQENTLAGLWGDIAIRRMRDSDGPGYLRACRAARLMREGITCATGRP